MKRVVVNFVSTLTVATYICITLNLPRSQLVAEAFCESKVTESSKGSPKSPKLLLFIVVDQFSPLHLQRFRGSLSGGISRLLDSGTVYTDASYAHAAPHTCSGHATLATGAHPKDHGIVSNNWLDEKSGDQIHCVGSKDDMSPRYLRTKTIGDELKQKFPKSRVFSVSGKDRAAIMLGGHNPDGVFWFDKNRHNFVSSKYAKASDYLIGYVTTNVELRLPFGEFWDLSTVVKNSISSRQVVPKDGDKGWFSAPFPRAFGGIGLVPNSQFYNQLYRSPMLDTLTGLAARLILDGGELGKREDPDLLFVSFSSLATVGHEWGPDSTEAFDTLVNVDREVEKLIEAALCQVGQDRLAVVLTSDYGVLPLTEAPTKTGIGTRLSQDAIACVQRVGEKYRGKFKFEYGGLADDFRVWASPPLKNKIIDFLTNELKKCPQVRAVFGAHELQKIGNDELSYYRKAFYLGHFDGRSPEVYILWQEGVLPLVTTFETRSGMPYRYDSHVPLIVRAPGQVVGKIVKESITMDQVAKLTKDITSAARR